MNANQSKVQLNELQLENVEVTVDFICYSSDYICCKEPDGWVCPGYRH